MKITLFSIKNNELMHAIKKRKGHLDKKTYCTDIVYNKRVEKSGKVGSNIAEVRVVANARLQFVLYLERSERNGCEYGEETLV